MQDVILVQISKAFKKGSLNTKMFKDIPYMNDNELKILFEFMQSVQSGKALVGKNKPSWQNDNKSEIPNTEEYKQGKHWHYHCGPYINQEDSSYKYVQFLEMNIQGKVSKAVIHYQKLTKNHIVIVAYSPQHIPFPKATALLNPILQRAE